jgi:uncharacterized protein
MQSHDGLTLYGWHVLPAGKTATGGDGRRRELQDGQPVVLYFSGNAANRAYRGLEFSLLADLGCHVLVYDYRGYGENPGSPSEAHLAADARSAWQYATGEQGIEPGRIILMGESLGGAVAVRLAAEQSQAGSAPGGLVLRAAFSSLVDAGATHYPWLPGCLSTCC